MSYQNALYPDEVQEGIPEASHTIRAHLGAHNAGRFKSRFTIDGLAQNPRLVDVGLLAVFSFRFFFVPGE